MLQLKHTPSRSHVQQYWKSKQERHSLDGGLSKVVLDLQTHIPFLSDLRVSGQEVQLKALSQAAQKYVHGAQRFSKFDIR